MPIPTVRVSMESEIYRLLMKKAGALLARRSYSRGELRDRLAKTAGELPIDPVLNRLEQLNLLNDADYAYNFAFCRIQQEGWSPAKVQTSLLRRQVDATTVENALKRVRDELGDKPALASYVRKYCGKRGLPSDLAGVRKLILHLRRRGFDDESIFGALREMIPAAVLQQLETGD